MDTLQPAAAAVVVAGDAVVVGGDAAAAASAVAVGVARTSGGSEKRKRGRPPRGQVTPKPQPPRKVLEEEDVCFICFDGGSLVLCDRKGCPKAYHPSCIKRDESYFSSKAKWNCGWHICSVCQKASHYMCYTCTYSLCKGCTKNADYACVRGNKGFCSMCMKTIMLIENKDEANKEKVQVDFDDITTWEYLFKVYWIDLKGKLSLTLNELIQAKRLVNEASIGSVVGGRVDLAEVRGGSETAIAPLSTENVTSADNSETEKIWYYRDPTGKIQGPFSMSQLRGWSNGGFFPPDLKVWKNDEHDQSVLLTDVLHQLSQKSSQITGNVAVQSSGLGAVSDNKGSFGAVSDNKDSFGAVSDNKGSFGLHDSSSGTVSESKQTKILLPQGAEKVCSNVSNENVRTHESGTHSFLDLLKGNTSLSDKSQEHSPLHLSSQVKMHVGVTPLEKGFEGGRFHSFSGHGNQNSCGSIQVTVVQGHEMHSNSKSCAVQSSGQNWESLPITTSKPMHSVTHFASVPKTEPPEQNGRMNFTALLNHTPKGSDKSWEVQAAEELLSLSSGFPIQRSNIIRDVSSPSPSGEDMCGRTTETKEHSTSNVPVQDSGRSWSSASSLVINEWDSGLVSNPPLKTVGDHVATPTSNTDHLTTSSPPHLITNVSNWQPIEFTTLDEESVSDLLAEVDALESQSGLGSPASALRCSKETIPRCKNEYFNFFEELNPMPDPAKNVPLGSLHHDR
ncbi:PREDICTED: zinc finger CCCH domain-containing protein 44-like isoform X2 [Ipomoea nil]|uniref:zinc finger CCCH domain-containing protein 44-like isoform X2 n=1 Tax=Ipomoea nil TaxID=35883 RepID=UPI0009009EA4|nr:PREDICTED: zinc finger CCCH domain-containing protein 44-like isoform X2 [Ipomoea nil]